MVVEYLVQILSERIMKHLMLQGSQQKLIGVSDYEAVDELQMAVNSAIKEIFHISA